MSPSWPTPLVALVRVVFMAATSVHVLVRGSNAAACGQRAPVAFWPPIT